MEEAEQETLRAQQAQELGEEDGKGKEDNEDDSSDEDSDSDDDSSSSEGDASRQGPVNYRLCLRSSFPLIRPFNDKRRAPGASPLREVSFCYEEKQDYSNDNGAFIEEGDVIYVETPINYRLWIEDSRAIPYAFNDDHMKPGASPLREMWTYDDDGDNEEEGSVNYSEFYRGKKQDCSTGGTVGCIEDGDVPFEVTVNPKDRGVAETADNNDTRLYFKSLVILYSLFDSDGEANISLVRPVIPMADGVHIEKGGSEEYFGPEAAGAEISDLVRDLSAPGPEEDVLGIYIQHKDESDILDTTIEKDPDCTTEIRSVSSLSPVFGLTDSYFDSDSETGANEALSEVDISELERLFRSDKTQSQIDSEARDPEGDSNDGGDISEADFLQTQCVRNIGDKIDALAYEGAVAVADGCTHCDCDLQAIEDDYMGMLAGEEPSGDCYHCGCPLFVICEMREGLFGRPPPRATVEYLNGAYVPDDDLGSLASWPFSGRESGESHCGEAVGSELGDDLDSFLSWVEAWETQVEGTRIGGEREESPSPTANGSTSLISSFAAPGEETERGPELALLTARERVEEYLAQQKIRNASRLHHGRNISDSTNQTSLFSIATTTEGSAGTEESLGDVLGIKPLNSVHLPDSGHNPCNVVVAKQRAGTTMAEVLLRFLLLVLLGALVAPQMLAGYMIGNAVAAWRGTNSRIGRSEDAEQAGFNSLVMDRPRGIMGRRVAGGKMPTGVLTNTQK